MLGLLAAQHRLGLVHRDEGEGCKGVSQVADAAC